MMDEQERDALSLQALADQAIEMQREHIADLDRVSTMDADLWTPRDRLIAQRALCALLYLLKEGRI